MNCKRCKKDLILTQRVFKNNTRHFEAFCPRCHFHRYMPQTEANKKLFESARISLSRKLINKKKQVKPKVWRGLKKAQRIDRAIKGIEKVDVIYENYMNGALE